MPSTTSGPRPESTSIAIGGGGESTLLGGPSVDQPESAFIEVSFSAGPRCGSARVDASCRRGLDVLVVGRSAVEGGNRARPSGRRVILSGAARSRATPLELAQGSSPLVAADPGLYPAFAPRVRITSLGAAPDSRAGDRDRRARPSQSMVARLAAAHSRPRCGSPAVRRFRLPWPRTAFPGPAASALFTSVC
jgi:hypothetical protein